MTYRLLNLGHSITHSVGLFKRTIFNKPLNFEKNVKAYIIDTNNRIHYVQKEESIYRDKQYGKYVSFVPMTEYVRGVTLKGFAYPLDNATLTNDKSLAISNQIVENVAWVSYSEGVLLMIESSD